MARKPSSSEPPQLEPPKSDREKIIETFMAILADKPIETIGFGEISARAGVPLTRCRAEFGTVFAILAAYAKELDQQVLAGGDGDMSEEPPRERLFDVLMRRIEALAPHKAAMQSLVRSTLRNPGLAFAINPISVRSQSWMLTAAGIDASGTRGAIRAQGLAMLFASVLRTWVDDDDPGLARTMAALDRALASGQRWSGWLDDLCRLTPSRCRPPRSRFRHRDEGDEPVVAA